MYMRIGLFKNTDVRLIDCVLPAAIEATWVPCPPSSLAESLLGSIFAFMPLLKYLAPIILELHMEELKSSPPTHEPFHLIGTPADMP
jgi:hypothetical protein